MTDTAKWAKGLAGLTEHRPAGLNAAKLLLLLALGGAVPGYGAEAEPRDKTRDAKADAEPVAAAGSERAGRTASAGTQPAADNEGDFTPSEEISEDFAVSFPVDI